MAETKQTVEREYVIPLRSSWKNVPRYKKTSKSIKTIKEFVAKHMKVPDRDTNKVKLDLYLNNELWLRGAKKPPSKIKIKARKEGELIKVELVDLHENMKFAKAREEKFHKKVEKKEVKKKEIKEEKTEEEKVEEKEEVEEKEKSVEESQIKMAKQTARAEKHTIGTKPTPQIQRKALKK